MTSNETAIILSYFTSTMCFITSSQLTVNLWFQLVKCTNITHFVKFKLSFQQSLYSSVHFHVDSKNIYSRANISSTFYVEIMPNEFYKSFSLFLKNGLYCEWKLPLCSGKSYLSLFLATFSFLNFQSISLPLIYNN